MSSSLPSERPQPDGLSASQPLPARHFLGNQFVYCVLSQRAGGLSVGINLNPDKLCNFDCIYCEIDRRIRGGSRHVKLKIMIEELERTLGLIHAERFGELGFGGLPKDMLSFKEVALSGDGEPTLSPDFQKVVEAIVHLRARRVFPFFKIVLITNAVGIGIPAVNDGIDLLSSRDDVWVKLDAGTQGYMDMVNRPGISIEFVLRNILSLGLKRPVVIQSLFPLVEGREPSEREIHAYAENLRELKDAGAKISLVQIYSSHRAAMNLSCGHLSLRTLSRIAQTVREVSGLKAEVF